MLLTRVGDVVELAGAVDLDGGMPDFFEVRERRVDHTGTRYVKALGAFVQRFDDFVAMAGLFSQQPQYQELKIDRGQFSAHTEGPAAHVAAHESSAKMTEPATAMMAPKVKVEPMMHCYLQIRCKTYLTICIS